MAVDASVLINLAIVDRFALLSAFSRWTFVTPVAAIDEVRHPEQRRRLDAGLSETHLRLATHGEEASARRVFADLRDFLGPGESACLALAEALGGLIACDERRAFRREALRRLGPGRLLTTTGLFLAAIRVGYWSVAEADTAKEVLASNRFRIKLVSFAELL